MNRIIRERIHLDKFINATRSKWNKQKKSWKAPDCSIKASDEEQIIEPI